MESLAQVLTASHKPLVSYAEKLLVGVTPERFARQPVGRDGLVNTNHPAFILGHLSIYPSWTLSIIGVEDPGFTNPGGFDELFSYDATCRDDADGTIYPAMDAVTAHFFDANARMFAAIAEMPDEHLAAPHGQADEFFQQFPSRAAFAMFMSGPHQFTHLGQLSAWRRCEGLGSAY
jgi:hypothetical protein